MIFASTVEHLGDSFMGFPDANAIRKTDSKLLFSKKTLALFFE